jgi:hypothetical protein
MSNKVKRRAVDERKEDEDALSCSYGRCEGNLRLYIPLIREFVASTVDIIWTSAVGSALLEGHFQPE